MQQGGAARLAAGDCRASRAPAPSPPRRARPPRPPCAASQRRVQPGELALDIALGRPRSPSPISPGNDQVQVGQRIDQRLADAPVELRSAGEFRRDVVADDEAAAPLLDDEHRADDAFVLAQQEALRRQRKAPMQHRQHAVLAPHVVRPGGIGPNGGRRSTNSFVSNAVPVGPHPSPPPLAGEGVSSPSPAPPPPQAGEGWGGGELQQVSQVGLAAAELAHRQCALGAGQMRAQIGFEPARSRAARPAARRSARPLRATAPACPSPCPSPRQRGEGTPPKSSCHSSPSPRERGEGEGEGRRRGSFPQLDPGDGAFVDLVGAVDDAHHARARPGIGEAEILADAGRRHAPGSRGR